jgi:polyhydroxybutyrate depolymerase
MKTNTITGRRIIKVVLTILGACAAIPITGIALFEAVNRTNGKIVSSGEMRRYLIHVPDSYDPAKPTPLVFNIHGFAQWPANQQHISKWNDLADKERFIVVYPMGTQFPLRWNSHLPIDISPETQKDVTFFVDMIEKFSREYNIDPDRIYASGLSNGGGMAFVLSCTLSDRIAAIGTVAGAYTYPWEACMRQRPVPLIAFHGLVDQVVPYYGGYAKSISYHLPSISEWIAEYARRNGCIEENSLPINDKVTGVHYTCCDQHADVIFYTIRDGGHSWPGGNPLPKFIVGNTSQDIDATHLMWEFFKAHPRNN